MHKVVDSRNIAIQKALAMIVLLIILGGLYSAQPVLAQSPKTGETNALVIQADFAGLVMTGVAYSVSSKLDVFNVRPLIPLYDIAAASASLEYNAQTWPAGTVFVSVVDPGVGTSRKSVVLKTKNGLFFVSPDNGSLSGPATAYGIEAVREIDENLNRIPGSDWSHTFHGRDVYSYTGARLAAGVIDFTAVGPLLDAKVIKLAVAQSKLVNGELQGHVAGGTGRLGNVYFNIDRDLFARMEPSYGEKFRISIEHDGQIVWVGELPYVKSFGAVAVGENLMFMNSSGALSLAVNQGNFAQAFGIGSGTDWTVTVRSKESTLPPFTSLDRLIESRSVQIPVTLVTPTRVTDKGIPLVLLIHGHGGTRHEAGGFTRVAQGLAGSGIASIRMDFSGCGESSETFTNNNISNMLADIEAAKKHALAEVKVDKNRLGLLGFSMGGRLAITLAAQDQPYRAMGLWAPSASNGAASMVKYLGGRETYTRMKNQARTDGFAPFTTFWGQHQQLGYRWFTDLETSMPGDDIAKFGGALFVLYGDLDEVVPPAIAQSVVTKAINASSVSHYIVKGADHGLGLFDDDFASSEQAVNNTIAFFIEHI